MDKKGNLYGAALLGGVNDQGAIYELSPPLVPGNPCDREGSIFLQRTDGTLPSGRLLLDASGTLYGTTDGGGAGQAGTVFQLRSPAAPA